MASGRAARPIAGRSARISGARSEMTTRNMIEAINDAHRVVMERDDDIVVFGEDVGFFGGVFRATAGLQEKLGKTRCFDARIWDVGIRGTAVGLAACGT